MFRKLLLLVQHMLIKNMLMNIKIKLLLKPVVNNLLIEINIIKDLNVEVEKKLLLVL